MFKFDNSHIFTGYLKQMLSSFNLPSCRIYTKEFANYLEQHGKEDPRIIESFDNITYFNGVSNKTRTAARINYLKGNELYNYFWDYNQNDYKLNRKNGYWKHSSTLFYHKDAFIPGLTKTLESTGVLYDTSTHEYLGEYLRFMRDYYDINLMSLYNCFNNKIYSNIFYQHKIKIANPAFNIHEDEGKNNKKYLESTRTFDSHDSKYRIYAFPVKLFSDYTIAIDCSQEIEMFCGFYSSTLNTSNKSVDLINKTYKKVNKTLFKQPFLYDKLNVKYWNFERDCEIPEGASDPQMLNAKVITRWDIANREQDLKLFIKIPTSCRSSITVLEGDYRGFNDFCYTPPGVYMPDGKLLIKSDSNADDAGISITKNRWEYKQNHSITNFDCNADLNEVPFTPIGKLQLLAFNTGESYPFADRLVEYLTNSAITPIDEIADNIKRAQKVMAQNQHHFKLEGLWENKMQKIIYDYIMNSGPIEAVKTDSGIKLTDKKIGYHPRLGHTSKSSLYDVLGYIDRDAEKLYASWTHDNSKAVVRDSIQNIDIYDGLYDI